jgi:transmembrane carrier protein
LLSSAVVVEIVNEFFHVVLSFIGMMATCIVQPIDLMKNRLQMDGVGGGGKAHKSTAQAMIHIAKSEGFFGVYNGYAVPSSTPVPCTLLFCLRMNFFPLEGVIM